jgi:hypothetical protein
MPAVIPLDSSYARGLPQPTPGQTCCAEAFGPWGRGALTPSQVERLSSPPMMTVPTLHTIGPNRTKRRAIDETPNRHQSYVHGLKEEKGSTNEISRGDCISSTGYSKFG